VNDVREPATLSSDRRYRFTFGRRVRFGEDICLFIMLNPSTADESIDDPTIRRCIDFANRWGYGWLHVVNIFPFRATDPEVMKAAFPEPKDILAQNLEVITKLVSRSETVVAAWGNHGAFKDRGTLVLSALATAGLAVVHCLGMTDQGQPKHPLYVPKVMVPVELGMSIA
jgi:hypothetical protein